MMDKANKDRIEAAGEARAKQVAGLPRDRIIRTIQPARTPRLGLLKTAGLILISLLVVPVGLAALALDGWRLNRAARKLNLGGRK